MNQRRFVGLKVDAAAAVFRSFPCSFSVSKGIAFITLNTPIGWS